jgi:hypothetical protein
MVYKLALIIKKLGLLIGYHLDVIAYILSICVICGALVCYVYALNIIFFREIKDNYHNYLDRSIPLAIITIPLLLCILSKEVLFNKVIFLIFALLILLPTFSLWAHIRNWHEETMSYFFYYHPRHTLLFLDASVYPIVVIFYFTLIRYLRLATDVNVYKIFESYYYLIPWILATLPLIVVILFFLSHKFLIIREYYWIRLLELLQAINIKLLQNKLYFKVMEKLHKFSYFIYIVVTDGFSVFPHKRSNYVFSRLTAIRLLIVRFFRFIYWKSAIRGLLIIFLLVLEIFINDGILHYGLYMLFFYPLVKAIMLNIVEFSQMDFVHVTCISDYLAHNWKHIHYPHYFWWCVDEAEDMFPIIWNIDAFPEKTQNLIAILRKQTHDQERVFKTLENSLQLCSMYDRTLRIKTTFFPRLAITYRQFYHTRWVHTNNTVGGYYNAKIT